MAEGWARHLKGDRIEPFSAGVDPHRLNLLAVKAMAESGVDISGHTSKHVDTLSDVPLDIVVTVCGHAHEICPVFPEPTRVVHVGFDDPPTLAMTAQSEAEALGHYRRAGKNSIASGDIESLGENGNTSNSSSSGDTGSLSENGNTA